MSPPILASSLTLGNVTTPNTMDCGITLGASSWSVMVVASVVLRLAAERLFSGLPGLWAQRLLRSSVAPSSMSIFTSQGLSGDILSASKKNKMILLKHWQALWFPQAYPEHQRKKTHSQINDHVIRTLTHNITEHVWHFTRKWKKAKKLHIHRRTVFEFHGCTSIFFFQLNNSISTSFSI